MKKKSLLLIIAISIYAMFAIAQKTGTFTDSRDGKKYKTIKIGAQTWMAENLAYKAKYGCWAYDNNINNVTKIGYLYNWETAKSACPKGWHLPNDAEWKILIDYLGGESVAGGKLKETELTHWTSPNIGATNETGFTAIPGGYRYNDGTFSFVGIYGYWWSATEVDSINVWNYGIYNNYGYIVKGLGNKKVGFSVRCLRNN